MNYSNGRVKCSRGFQVRHSRPTRVDWNAQEKEHLADELADVLIYLVRLSDKCGVDLAQAALHKIVKNSHKYPVEKVKGSSKYDYESSAKKIHGVPAARVISNK